MHKQMNKKKTELFQDTFALWAGDGCISFNN